MCIIRVMGSELNMYLKLKNVAFRIFSSIQTSKLADQLKDLLTRAR